MIVTMDEIGVIPFVAMDEIGVIPFVTMDEVGVVISIIITMDVHINRFCVINNNLFNC
jgi:hypothetical protein